MRFTRIRRIGIMFGVAGILASVNLSGQDDATQEDKNPKHAARTEFLKDEIQKIRIEVTDKSDKRDYTVQLQPILRYSDASRGVADSALWRVGTTGRPIAFVTSEVYGPSNGTYRLNHEYTAVDEPHMTMKSGYFTWRPPVQKLEFVELKSGVKPSDKPQLRMTQMKALVRRFTARQEFQGNKVELRSMPTPLYRYQPSDKPQSDGAIFAIAWGVNPEIMLFIESDGEKWSFACARTAAANLWVQFDEVEVWKRDSMNFQRLDNPIEGYAIADSPVAVPAKLYDDSPPEK